MTVEEITPEGSEAPVYLDPTPRAPMDAPDLSGGGTLQRALDKVEKAQILTPDELAALA